jgi:hypothetical protein
MSATQPIANQTSEELPLDVAELAAAILRMPADVRTKLEPLVARVVDSTKRRRRILALVQDALGQLRLDMKYLVFDLEATRRERDALKNAGSQDQPFPESGDFE